MMISVILIEYHSIDDILFFLDYSQGFLGENYELIVSSNSLYSKDEQSHLESQYSFINWIFNERNGGFAYGMNEGLKRAHGDSFVIMNPDVKLKSSLLPMSRYLISNRDIGIIAPKVVDKNGVIQDSFRDFITPWGFFRRHIERITKNNQLHINEQHTPTNVDWVIGAFMMCRRDFYEKIGGLSDDYFMYCEDMDWCKRAHLAGYNVVYFPNTVIEYKGTRAARQSFKFAGIFIKSLFTFWKKYGIK